MQNMLCKLWQDDSGQDLAEYAILLGVILVLVVAGVTAIGTDVNGVFGRSDAQLKTVP